MKRIFLLALLFAAVGCTGVDDSHPRETVHFEGEEWSAYSATTAGVKYSSDLVAGGYKWCDKRTTLTSEALVDNTYGYAYIRGGMLVSSYNSADIKTYGDYSKDLYVYCATSSSEVKGGGNNGSDRFAIVVGNYDSTTNSEVSAEMYFADGYARQIQGCYVNSTTYFLNVAQNGNPSIAAPLGDDDEIVISATGFDSSGAETATVRMTLARKNQYIKQWTSWDLRDLGKVVKVRFNVEGGPKTEWGMTTPKYFAIDDIVVEKKE